jgi:hypothetical protein
MIAATLTATLGAAAACWVVAAEQARDMDMGGRHQAWLVPFLCSIVGLHDGGDDAPERRPGGLASHPHQRALRPAPVFAAPYIAIWAIVGIAVYAFYRPRETVAVAWS